MTLDGVHQIDVSLTVDPAPGHTPGHVALKLAFMPEFVVGG